MLKWGPRVLNWSWFGQWKDFSSMFVCLIFKKLKFAVVQIVLSIILALKSGWRGRKGPPSLPKSSGIKRNTLHFLSKSLLFHRISSLCESIFITDARRGRLSRFYQKFLANILLPRLTITFFCFSAKLDTTWHKRPTAAKSKSIC